MDSLPIISIAGLRSPNKATRLATAHELGRACRDVGFFYAVHHGIPEAARAAAFAAGEHFFRLPLPKKQALSIMRSPHNRGYVAMADEKLNPDAGADLKEAFNIGPDLPADHPDVRAQKPFRGVNFWPDLPGWRTTATDYFNQCLDLGRVIHRGFSLDLGLPEDFFDSHLSNPIATLRMLRYPASTEQVPREDGGAGTHTDYGNVTILATDGVPGLEVLTRQGQWLAPPPVPGAFICNIGDCLMRWSNDTYVSTPHRVRPPAKERYALALFLEVDPESVIDPRDIAPGVAPRYAPITCANYLTARLNATYEHRSADKT